MNILNARQSDNALFHRPIREQRGQHKNPSTNLKWGNRYIVKRIIIGWNEQFKSLATKKDNDCFNLNFLKLVEEGVSVIYALCLDSSHDMNLVTDKEVTDVFA